MRLGLTEQEGRSGQDLFLGGSKVGATMAKPGDDCRGVVAA